MLQQCCVVWCCSECCSSAVLYGDVANAAAVLCCMVLSCYVLCCSSAVLYGAAQFCKLCCSNAVLCAAVLPDELKHHCYMPSQDCLWSSLFVLLFKPFYAFHEWDTELPPSAQPNLNYLAPEYALTASCDAASDLYSVGMLFYAVCNNGHTLYDCHGQYSSFKRSVTEVCLCLIYILLFTLTFFVSYKLYSIFAHFYSY